MYECGHVRAECTISTPCPHSPISTAACLTQFLFQQQRADYPASSIWGGGGTCWLLAPAPLHFSHPASHNASLPPSLPSPFLLGRRGSDQSEPHFSPLIAPTAEPNSLGASLGPQNTEVYTGPRDQGLK